MARKKKAMKKRCVECLSPDDPCPENECKHYQKKVKASEGRYTVSKTRSNAGSTDTDDITIVAKDGAEAAVKAMRSDPQRGRYDAVEISKDEGGDGGVRTEPDTVSKVKPVGLESLNFPYHLGLPMGWKPLFEALTKKVRENLTFGTRYGKLHIQVPDATTMASLITEVERKARGRTKVKHMARAVAHGINESVKK
jgi:hypothetical protein